MLDPIADKFRAKFKTALEALKPGDPMDEKTTQGPLSTEAARVQLLAQVDAAVRGGAKLLMGGKRVDRPGSFMQTTILTDRVASVASLFVIRWDVAVKQEISPPFHNRLGIAMAMRTYRAHLELLASERWRQLAVAGA